MHSAKFKFISAFIFIALLTILAGKLWTGWQHSYTPLYIYGVLVTSAILTTFAVTITKYKDPALIGAKLTKNQKSNPIVSCMVAVKDDEDIIEQCILSLVNQTYENSEIIFVDDASTDGTWPVLERYHNSGLIHAIHLDKNIGKKKALAKAMLRAKGEIFAFSDSDSVLAPDAIAKIVDVFNSDPLIGAVSGHCRAMNGDKNLVTKIQDSWYEGQFSVRKAFESVYGSVTCVSGPLAVFRKAAVFNFIPAWENDSFLGQEFRFATDRTLTGFVLGNKVIGDKLKKRYPHSPFIKRKDYPLQDWKVVYCKSARVLTNVPDTFGKMMKQQIRWKKSFIRNMFFTGGFYWRRPFLAALLYYLHVMFVLLGPIIAFRHLVYLPVKGDIFSPFLYLGGIIFIGMLFALAHQVEEKRTQRWLYRPLMSLMSTLIFSWLIFYSAATIKKMVWSRG